MQLDRGMMTLPEYGYTDVYVQVLVPLWLEVWRCRIPVGSQKMGGRLEERSIYLRLSNESDLYFEESASSPASEKTEHRTPSTTTAISNAYSPKVGG